MYHNLKTTLYYGTTSEILQVDIKLGREFVASFVQLAAILHSFLFISVGNAPSGRTGIHLALPCKYSFKNVDISS